MIMQGMSATAFSEGLTLACYVHYHHIILSSIFFLQASKYHIQ